MKLRRCYVFTHCLCGVEGGGGGKDRIAGKMLIFSDCIAAILYHRNV